MLKRLRMLRYRVLPGVWPGHRKLVPLALSRGMSVTWSSWGCGRKGIVSKTLVMTKAICSHGWKLYLVPLRNFLGSSGYLPLTPSSVLWSLFQMFTSCACTSSGNASLGLCPRECGVLIPYAIIFIVFTFAQSLLTAPGLILTMRYVVDEIACSNPVRVIMWECKTWCLIFSILT